MTSIPVLLAEGLVFTDGTLLRCEREGQAVDLDFSPFEGRRIYGLVAHLPTKGDRGSWGFGACALERTGTCGFGHHQAPHRLLLWQRSNEEFKREGGWWNVEPSGNFPPRDWLVGHRCKILLCPATFDPAEAPDGLLSQIGALSDLLQKIKNSR